MDKQDLLYDIVKSLDAKVDKDGEKNSKFRGEVCARLAEIEKDLKEHMRRTNILEDQHQETIATLTSIVDKLEALHTNNKEKIEKNKERIDKLEEPRKYLTKTGRIILFLGSLSGAIYAIYRLQDLF